MYYHHISANYISKTEPIPWEKLTKIKVCPMRHIEQLWDEIDKLKEEVKRLKNESKTNKANDD